MLNTPWPSIVHEPGQTWSEEGGCSRRRLVLRIIKTMSSKHTKCPRRTAKTFQELHFRSNQGEISFIAATRNPLDQMRSFIRSLLHKAEFRRMGDFPRIRQQRSNDERFLGRTVWLRLTYYNMAWFSRDEPNVHLVRFEELKQNHRGSIVDLAKFLDVELDDEQIDRIAFLSSFKEMKKVAHKFDYVLFANNENPKRTIMESGKLIRSGKSGEGQSFFTEEEKSRIRQISRMRIFRKMKEWMELWFCCYCCRFFWWMKSACQKYCIV